jgi:DNA-binding winged helix-turn-helix (wHTH) protein
MARRLALLIGNAVFDAADFPKLHTPANDVQDIARVLQEHGGFEILNMLVDQESGVISGAIDDLFGIAERGDLILLYYSGHGYRGRIGNYYLVAKDSSPKRMRSTSVPDFFVHNVMRSSRSRHRVIILDCCFSGAFIKGRKGDVEQLLLSELKGEAEAILASSGMIQFSFEEEGRNSLFTQYLLQGIETGDADHNGNGEISIDELFDYVDKRVRKARPGQTPVKEVSVRESEIIIAKNPKGSSPTSVQRKPERIYTIELNFPNAVRDAKDFYGRQEQLERIKQVFCSGTRRPVAIWGERRMGKTSIMNVVAARLQTPGAPRIVPLFPATVGINSLEDFAREILQSLCEFRGTSLTEVGLVGDDRRFRLTSVGQFFSEARKLLQDPPTTLYLLCIDEFDVLLYNCHKYGQPVEADKILDLSKELITQADLPLTFFLTLTHLPKGIQDALKALVIDQAERIDLLPLTPKDTDELLNGILGNRVILQTPQRRQLYRLSGGHPYVLKLLLANLLDRTPEDLFPLRVQASTLEQAADDAAHDSHAEHALGNILRVHFSPQERDLVTLMADLDDHITQEQLDRAGKEWRTVAENLARRGYFVRESTDDLYTFRFTFLGRWLRQRPVFEEHLYHLADLRQRLTASVDVGIEIEIDAERRRVLIRGQEVQLTPQEYQTMSFLCQHGGRLVTKDQLAEHLWPQSSGDVYDAAIASVVSRMRRKLGDSARQPRYLETKIGHGFILHRTAFVKTTTTVQKESSCD